MAVARNKIALSFSSTITLSEVEIRALDALVGYGDDAFIRAFKEKLGASYLRNHESGLRSFFRAVARDVLPALRQIDEAWNDLEEAARSRTSSRATALTATAQHGKDPVDG